MQLKQPSKSNKFGNERSSNVLHRYIFGICFEDKRYIYVLSGIIIHKRDKDIVTDLGLTMLNYRF